jgi:hypothetical protein
MMESIRGMFALGGGGRANNRAQRGRTDGNMGATRQQCRSATHFNAVSWDDASAPLGDDPTAPNVDARFGVTGECAPRDTTANNNIFDVGGGGVRHNGDTPRATSAPHREITQWASQEEGGEDPQEIVTAPKATTYSGIDEAIAKCGLGTNATIINNLTWQRSVGGDTTKINQWKEVMGSLQEFKSYIFVKRGSCFATVMHLPMKFTAISAATHHLLWATGPPHARPH